ncbi:uncharacterized protein LOC143917239 [Arctopsyche grandis]|uniref:uncharacterized protein LOC143917239 n=1 Tax=Arctopsyche grandis TaxID=121162 RepID=UPI00406D951B
MGGCNENGKGETQHGKSSAKKCAKSCCCISHGIRSSHTTHRSARRRAVYRGEQKNDAKERTRSLWQTRCDASTEGRWTHRLIRDLRVWSRRKHGELCFHPTQILTGHGCFGSYLHKIGKKVTSGCHHCSAENDDAEHTAFDCPAWNHSKKYILGVNPLTTINMIPAMLESAEAWTACTRFAVCIMQEKEEAERDREKRSRTS